MMILLIGGSGCGKSYYAEQLCEKIPGPRYYLAAMRPYGEESEKRILRHRQMREGKGFVTLEIPLFIEDALDDIRDPEESVVLLECVANLVGNGMHDDPNTAWMSYQGEAFEREFARTIVDRIAKLADRVCDMIVVTATFDPDPSDDEETVLYKRLVDSVNSELSKIAGKIREV